MIIHLWRPAFVLSALNDCQGQMELEERLMGSVATTAKYIKYWKGSLPLFVQENFKDKREFQIADEYVVCVKEYTGKVDKYNLRGSECVLLDGDRKIAEWKSIDNSSDFYKVIRHSNENKYLVFRQDLYGFSVLDLLSGEIMQYYPEKSLNGGETFIWTDVDYNPETDVLAVSGCYWACPNSVHLFTFDDPMSEKQKYVDLIEYFDGGYDRYDDVDFVKWIGGNMEIMRFDIETEMKEELIITQDVYLNYLCVMGREL